MSPFGTTVALLDQTDRPIRGMKVPRITTGVTPIFNFLLATLDALWRLLRRRGIKLVGKVEDETWQSIFRGLAIHSRLIVMDVSSSGSGLTYEADFIADLWLADRLILIHAVGSAPNETLRHLQERGLSAPVLSYRTWRLGQFARQLRRTARLIMDAKAQM
jgi:hypothetical protein